MNKKKILSLTLTLIFILTPSLVKAEIDPNFNPNNILTNSQMINCESMTLEDIQNFLEEKGSYLANYRTINTHGSVKKASEIIYDASVNNYDCEGVNLSEDPSENEKEVKCKKITTVNPKFLLVLLQKEQSLIEDSNPKQSQLDWATGYGCPDGSSCNPYWKGFGKQINSAALQFKWYLKNNHQYSYEKNETYEFSNPYSTIKEEITLVTPQNDATAALYNYTPHVYNGNYNVYKLWKKYFPAQTYPNGTLLQAKGEIGVWLIENSKKRPFLSKSALTSRFDINKIITVDKASLSAYPKGPSIKFPNYSLVRSPRGDIYLLVDNKKRAFVNMKAFRNIGYNVQEIMDAGWEHINSYENGAPITENSVYPTGALLQNNKTGGVYWVEEGKKAPITDKSFLTYKFPDKKIIAVTPEKLKEYETVDPILFDNGELIKSSATPAVYLIDNGKKRPFSSGEDFIELGYKWENIIVTSPQVLYKYPDSQPVTVEK